MDRPPILLAPTKIEAGGPEFDLIARWPYADSFVSRLLQTDIPRRARREQLEIWLFRDPHGQEVGFGTIDLADDHAGYSGGLAHPYIPPLAVNPTIPSRGYGSSIWQHLIGQAAVIRHRHACPADLFLDVYVTSIKAIALDEKFSFVRVNSDPIPDSSEGNLPYNIMARRVVAISGTIPLFVEGR